MPAVHETKGNTVETVAFVSHSEGTVFVVASVQEATIVTMPTIISVVIWNYFVIDVCHIEFEVFICRILTFIRYVVAFIMIFIHYMMFT